MPENLRELQTIPDGGNDGFFKPGNEKAGGEPSGLCRSMPSPYFFLAAVFQIVVWFFLAQARASGEAAQRIASRIIS